uniref:C-type lectin domain-containing protein n=1 Tax=Acrobeloides nanus TaxID=290746 RepID=A0A914DMH0_9BILA
MASEASCNCYGGHLATVDNAFENMFVNKQLKSFNFPDAWLGLVRLYNESDSSNYTWSWTEGRQIGYDAWAVGEPKRNNVGYFSNGKWNTFWYFNTYSYNGVTIKNYVCQIPNDGLHCPRTNGTNYWTYYSSINSCYQYNRKSDTFDDVYENCDQLLSIHSQEESDILLNYITASGLSSYSCSVWVGVMDPYKNGSWQWADGSPLNYTNWAPGEPRNVAPCAQIGGADTGVWQSSCDSIGCTSGDCFEGVTLCAGCPATNTAPPTSVPMTTSAMETCDPNVCNCYCQQHECRSGSCDLYYSGVADNPCACDTCLDPSMF